MGTKYTQLNLEEREKLYAMQKQGKSLRQIATELGRHHTSLGRELKRNAPYGAEYIPCKAAHISQKRAVHQRTKAPLKNIKIFSYVRDKLRMGWSPEIIAGRLKIDHPGESICTETIYQYIYGKGKKYHLHQYLVNRHKKRRVKTGRRVKKDRKPSRIPNAIMIDKRPTKANNRSQIGHYETDLMEGPWNTSHAVSVTVERKTRVTVLSKVRNKQAKTKAKVLTTRLKKIQSLSKSKKPIVRSITYDNGSENSSHEDAATELNVESYFCYPYHSWEKGTVENRIGVIRRDIPKGTSLHKYTHKQIQALEDKLNNTPMKCLDFQTPYEALEKEVNRYKFRKHKLS